MEGKNHVDKGKLIFPRLIPLEEITGLEKNMIQITEI